MKRRAKSEAIKGAALLALLAALGLLVLLLLKRPERSPPRSMGASGVREQLDVVDSSSQGGPASREDSLSPKSGTTRLSSADDYLHRLSELSINQKEEALLFAHREGAQFGEQGLVAEARDAMAVTLLVDLGRMDEARVAVRRFISAFPESRYRALVQGVTGVHPRPGPPIHLRP